MLCLIPGFLVDWGGAGVVDRVSISRCLAWRRAGHCSVRRGPEYLSAVGTH